MCERSSQNGPWRFECSNFTSKNVIYVVHVLVKRSKTFKNPAYLYASLCGFRQSLVGSEPRTLHSTYQDVNEQATMTLEICPGNLDYSQKKLFCRDSKNPKKSWKSEKNWNSRFQNFEKIDLIILQIRSNRSNRKKSPYRLDRFVGQRINTSSKGRS